MGATASTRLRERAARTRAWAKSLPRCWGRLSLPLSSTSTLCPGTSGGTQVPWTRLNLNWDSPWRVRIRLSVRPWSPRRPPKRSHARRRSPRRPFVPRHAPVQERFPPRQHQRTTGLGPGLVRQDAFEARAVPCSPRTTIPSPGRVTVAGRTLVGHRRARFAERALLLRERLSFYEQSDAYNLSVRGSGRLPRLASVHPRTPSSRRSRVRGLSSASTGRRLLSSTPRCLMGSRKYTLATLSGFA